ncbi:triose-phosphate isomerase [Bacillus shivajii]|uniref:triose-phosphate isomerase n=1 Tax=Bacillus shivajii TaxID=1983719 RepID=UPI001CF9B2EE|nr:triose-phosphate isomerase [Bacillus shivajii]UCZ52764.1 triose-phosphate isomerase [Bacillus shivajii]
MMNESTTIQHYVKNLVEEAVHEVLGKEAETPLQFSPRRKLVVGNWKMNMSMELVGDFARSFQVKAENSEVVICPPFPLIYPAKVAFGQSHDSIFLGAQDVHAEDSGAHTGEVSADMLTEVGCQFAIVGHSERREAGETDEEVALKVKQALRKGIEPIICVGETLDERELGKTNDVVENQVLKALEKVDDVSKVILAYEPVWAIGTGLSATADEAQTVHQFIRETVSGRFGEVAQKLPILYGGSVKPDTAGNLAAMNDIDGVLVGGASLKAEDFAAIVEAFERG